MVDVFCILRIHFPIFSKTRFSVRRTYISYHVSLNSGEFQVQWRVEIRDEKRAGSIRSRRG